MEIKTITCIECPNGCEISVSVENNQILKIEGNQCPRGQKYAQEEITCPRRVITSTVKTINGEVLPVKTDQPVKKTEIFEIMQKINSVIIDKSVIINEIIVKNITEDINLIATDNKEIK